MGILVVLNMFFRLVSVLVGFLYPAYSSYKAVEMKNPEMMSLWLVYWAVFGLFSVIEVFLDMFLAQITLYYMGKLAFLIWLQMPQTKVCIDECLWWIVASCSLLFARAALPPVLKMWRG